MTSSRMSELSRYEVIDTMLSRMIRIDVISCVKSEMTNLGQARLSMCEFSASECDRLSIFRQLQSARIMKRVKDSKGQEYLFLHGNSK